MKALVTGGNGFIGSHLVELLLSRSYSVRCLVRKTSDLIWLNGLNVELVYGDLSSDRELGEAVTGVDYVYHSAGVTKAKKKEDYYRGNTTGTKNILDAVARHNPEVKRFVFLSSGTAAGPSEPDSPVTEATPPHPITTYGKSKLLAEMECLKYSSAIPLTIVRPPAVYGPRDKDVFEFFNTMNKGLQPMVGMSEQYVSLIHVSDLVRGTVMAGESEQAVGQTYFISSKEVYGWKQIGDITREVLGRRVLRLRIPALGVYAIGLVAEFAALFSSKPALINMEKARDMVQGYWTFNSSKAKRDFGFEQSISLKEGITETVQWYKSNGWLR
jgi:nucleoside-diphosphate-sugar epimerase